MLFGVAAATALLLSGIAIVDLRAGAGLASMQTLTRELQREFDARPFTREPLWGSASAERAFDHYDKAMAQAAALIEPPKRMAEFWKHRREPANAKHDALRAQWQPLVNSMRIGAHATDIRPVRVGEKHFHTTNLLAARGLCNLAIDAAERALDTGDQQTAIELTLDASTFTHDLMQRGSLIDQMVGCGLLAIATGEAWPEAQLARLDAGNLQRLAIGLERLDRMLQPAIDGHGEVLTLAHSLGNAPLGCAYGPSLQAWSFGFSTRWMLADAFSRAVALVRTLDQERTLPWPQRCALFQLELGELKGRSNPMLDMLVPNYESAEFSRRMSVAMLRLLRMSIALHQGLSLPPLTDPLGAGPIAVRIEGEGTHLHCVGSQQRKQLARFVIR
jgi:hypothetical protein